MSTNSPAAGLAAQSIAGGVPTAFILLEAIDRRALANCATPITVAQYHALAALDRVPRQNMGDLARRLLCDKANASKIIDRLEGLGLASRRRDDADARRVVLSITPTGRRVLQEATRMRHAALRAVFTGVEPTEMARLEEAVTRLVDLFGAAADDAGERNL